MRTILLFVCEPSISFMYYCCAQKSCKWNIPSYLPQESLKMIYVLLVEWVFPVLWRQVYVLSGSFPRCHSLF